MTLLITAINVRSWVCHELGFLNNVVLQLFTYRTQDLAPARSSSRRRAGDQLISYTVSKTSCTDLKCLLLAEARVASIVFARK